ncbi:MAG: hypothetical protein HY225_03940 [Candidatus Vogelbacteria bacterium]|nr:hypothetical protein [Candidatus Vogelbacteria bacterium]
MQTIKNAGLAIFGIGLLWLVIQVLELATWSATLLPSIGLKLLGFGALVGAGYASLVYGAKKFASLFE